MSNAWPMVSGLAGILFTLIGAANLYMMDRIRSEVLKLRLEIAQQRYQDREETHQWVEERFERRPSAGAS